MAWRVSFSHLSLPSTSFWSRWTAYRSSPTRSDPCLAKDEWIGRTRYWGVNSNLPSVLQWLQMTSWGISTSCSSKIRSLLTFQGFEDLTWGPSCGIVRTPVCWSFAQIYRWSSRTWAAEIWSSPPHQVSSICPLRSAKMRIWPWLFWMSKELLLISEDGDESDNLIHDVCDEGGWGFLLQTFAEGSLICVGDVLFAARILSLIIGQHKLEGAIMKLLLCYLFLIIILVLLS